MEATEVSRIHSANELLTLSNNNIMFQVFISFNILFLLPLKSSPTSPSAKLQLSFSRLSTNGISLENDVLPHGIFSHK